MESKTILQVLGSAAVLTTLFAFKKKADFSKVMEKMTIDIRAIRNLRIVSSKLMLDMDLGFHNPTEYDMTLITAGFIKVKEINLFYNQKLIGKAVSDQTNFELPAKSNYLLTDIKVELIYLSLLDQWLRTGVDTNVDNYQVHTIIEALGKTWVIEQ
jgi:hypothetical protein